MKGAKSAAYPPHPPPSPNDGVTYQQPIGVDGRRLHQPLHSLSQHHEGDGHEEQAIDKAAQHLHPPVPKGVDARWLPLAHEGCVQSHEECCAVKQHVEPVGDETEAVGPNSVQQLDKRVCLNKNDLRVNP